MLLAENGDYPRGDERMSDDYRYRKERRNLNFMVTQEIYHIRL